MDAKLLNILSKIGLEKSHMAYFESGSLLNVSVTKEKKLYQVEIQLDSPLPANVYVATLETFNKFLSQNDPEYRTILYIKLTKNIVDSKVIKDYINFYIDSKESNPDSLAFIKEQAMSIRNNEIQINYDSPLKEDYLNILKTKLERFLGAAGFSYLRIKYIFVEPEDNNIFDYEKDKEEYNFEKFAKLVEKDKEAEKKLQASLGNKPAFNNPRPSFKGKTFTKVELDEIPENVTDIEAEVKVFDVKPEGKSEKRFRLNFTNFKTSYTGHIWTNSKLTAKDINDTLDKWVTIKGTISYNQFDKEDAIDLFDITPSERKDAVIKDEEEVKRVELHAHTNMSAMDGISEVSDMVKFAASLGHKAIAITDHSAVQSFPDAQRTQAKLKDKGIDIKIIYGAEMNTAPRQLDTITNPSDVILKDATYVFFDLETSGLSCEFDDIIEFGAVKQVGNKEIDRIDILINPNHKISAFTTKLTKITNEMLADKPTIKEVLPQIIEFIGDSVLVAHNASFDIGFLSQALGHKITNPTIDTLPLCRYLYTDEKRYNLGSLCRSKGIDYDEESAHRGDYDAEVLRDLYFSAILPTLTSMQDDMPHRFLETMQSSQITRKMHPYHTNILVKNMVGMKNLFKIISIANTDYFTAQALVPPHVIDEHREGLLIGSSCARGEIFEVASTKTFDQLVKIMEWYDYIEIQPLDQYQILVDTEKVESIEKVERILNQIIKAAKVANKPIVATGDVHYIYESEAIAREVFISTPAIGGGYHPLFDFEHRVKKYPIQNYKTTKEMLDAFSYLGKDEAYEYVVTNPNLIADMIEDCKPLKDKLYPPAIPHSDEELTDICYLNAHKMYGENLPEIVEARLKRELNCIISNGYSIMYVIAKKCVENSAKLGFMVGSRGSVGSSFVATCAGITEINPLKPHYRCPHCGYSDFSIDETVYRSGFDLPDKTCPTCGEKLYGDGHNIPFETFLGFDGDKVPDIDLNFSSLNQADSHLFIRDLFGADKVFRAGTISSAAEKTAFGYAKKYYESIGIEIRNAEAARIAKLCEGVKRTTGQHPGGLIVIPNDMDVYDFTPVGHPADDIDSEWLTTHFAFEAIHDNVLKLDMLGHVDPTVLRMLELITGIDPHTIPLNDPKVIAEFNGGEVLDNPNLTSVGLPEFGTSVARKILNDAKPTSFADLTKVAGIAHGTNVFFGNIRESILREECTIVDCIGCRDDIMLQLMAYGIEPLASFKTMEYVRKGKAKKDPASWPKVEELLKTHNVPDWYIDACHKIEYLFPKAHAAAYSMQSVRIAWYKLYYPLEFYAAYYTWRVDAYDIEAMQKGMPYIKEKFLELNSRISNNEKLSVKEKALFDFYEISVEMYQRGYSFSNISLEKSMDNDFVVDHENNQLIPPFKVLDGVGTNAGTSVVEARKNGNFVSKEDLIKRTKLNGTNIKLLEKLGVLKKLMDTDQLTLF